MPRWTCQRDGMCCTQPDEVVMTHAERAAIEDGVSPTVSLRWLPHDDPRFVRLQAAPCPLYDGSGCTVYDVRPFNCRRFACLRTDLTQPYDAGPQTRADRRQLVVIQRHAQRWARSHGWEAS
jgi:Fe-S-cluster containining protein